MEENKAILTPADFKERMTNLMSEQMLEKHPLTALRLGIGLVVYVLKQEGFGEGADIFENALTSHHDEEKEKDDEQR